MAENETRFHAGHAIALHMVIELAREVPLTGDAKADTNVRNALARAREVQQWLEPLAHDKRPSASPAPLQEATSPTPETVTALDLAGMALARDAWREFAYHVAHCVECGEMMYESCFDGNQLHEAAKAADDGNLTVEPTPSRAASPLSESPTAPSGAKIVAVSDDLLAELSANWSNPVEIRIRHAEGDALQLVARHPASAHPDTQRLDWLEATRGVDLRHFNDGWLIEAWAKPSDFPYGGTPREAIDAARALRSAPDTPERP